MSVDKLPVFEDFPPGKGQSEIVLWIKMKIFRPISNKINFLLSLVNSGSIEIPADDVAPGTDGNWRWRADGSQLLLQRLVSGTWTNIAFSVEDVVTVKGLADGGRTNYDLKVGDVGASPTYGMIQFGNAVIGRTSFKQGDIDLDGSILFQNIGGPVTSQVEFCFAVSTGSSTRFALAKPGVGNASYHSRSFLIAGPAPANTDYVKVSYWRTNNNIFHNIDCDTAGDGADLGVQNDLEVEGDIFTDSLRESTPGAGIESNNSKLTSIGGLAVKLTNKTGAASVAGQQVKPDTATNDAVILTATSDQEAMGVFLDSGIADGAEAWIVHSGIADVRFEDNHGPARSDWVSVSLTDAGDAVSAASAPGAVVNHFREIGHCVETVAAGGPGTNVLARCVLHFN